MKKPLALSAMAIALGAATAAAHDTWLLPKTFAVPVHGTIELGLTSGMGFPKDDHAVEADRLAAASCKVDGETVELQKFKAEHALQLSVHVMYGGVAACAVETKPRTLELKPDEVEHYFAEADIADSVRRAWQAAPAPKRWRESYVKHAKAFVRVGDPEPGQVGWAPLGSDLELSPESDPTTLAAGQEIGFRLMRRGAPYGGPVVSAVSEGGGKPLRSTADAEGRVTFRFPTAGRWLLRAVDVQPAEKPDLDWQSHFATLTLEIQKGS